MSHSFLTSALFGLDGGHERTDGLLQQFRQTLEGHVVIRDIYSCREHVASEVTVIFFSHLTLISKNVNVSSCVPRMRAAVGISLALICDAQSLLRRVEEHFLVKSSKLSKIFL